MEAQNTTAAVQAVLSAHPSVRRSEVGVVTHNGTAAVLAVVEVTDFTTGVVLREHLAAETGVHLAVVVIEEIPSAGGQVDWAAIEAEAARSDGVWFESPADDLEAMVAGIWASVIGWDRVGMLDDFLESGGDSLMAMDLLGRIADQFGVDVDSFELMDSSTPRALSRVVRGHGVRVDGPIAWVTGAWIELLGESVAQNRSFFEQGGNSLLAAQLLEKLNQHGDFSLGFVYETPNIDGQAAALAARIGYHVTTNSTAPSM